VVVLASPLFDIFYDNVGIKYSLDVGNYILSFFLDEGALHFDFDQDISFDGDFSSFQSQSHHFLIQLQFL